MRNTIPAIELKDCYLGINLDLALATTEDCKIKILKLRETVSNITLLCSEAGLSVQESTEVLDAAKNLILVSPVVFVVLQDDSQK